MVITVADEKPAWVSERRRYIVAPRREGARVPVGLRPGSGTGAGAAGGCDRADDDRDIAGAAGAGRHRTPIDQPRVALSRATETLAFVDVAGDDDAHALSADLLKGRAPYHADDLVKHFADDAHDPVGHGGPPAG